LRARVLIAIGVVLVAAVGVGGLFAGWNARETLRQELEAALLGGRQTVASAFEDLPRSDHPARDLRQLIATFDGNRHVGATLIDAYGRMALRSRPAAARMRAPGWFSAWLDSHLGAARVSTPPSVAGYQAIVLTPLGDNDIGDAWRQFRDAMAIFVLACVSGVGLVYLTIGRALKPLSSMSAALARVGAGDYAIRIAETGPAELVEVSRRFNAMAGDLAAMRRRNRILEEQILKLQDEERAEIARDLHDEIGPHLFAVNIDAAMAVQSIAAGRPHEAEARVGAIQQAVGHMQRRVKDILARLRPARLVELGFEAAIEDLAAFWRERRPEIAIAVVFEIEGSGLSEPLQETFYRVVQEALSNAVRHGRPSRIDIRFTREDGRAAVLIVDDGRGGDAASPGGHGLIGMRERIEAVGGDLVVGRGKLQGWSVLARGPVSAPLEVSA
jgi:two-component system sensor histidine kinase UhpB